MIITILINLWILVLGVLGAILPKWDLPIEVYENMRLGSEVLYSLDFLFDVSLIYQTITLVIGFEIAIFVFRVVTGFISILRGGGSVDI